MERVDSIDISEAKFICVGDGKTILMNVVSMKACAMQGSLTSIPVIELNFTAVARI
jgi:hypothetical protein